MEFLAECVELHMVGVGVPSVYCVTAGSVI